MAEIESEIGKARGSLVERAGIGVDSPGDIREQGFAHSLPSDLDLLGSELLESLVACNASRLLMVVPEASFPWERPFQTPITWGCLSLNDISQRIGRSAWDCDGIYLWYWIWLSIVSKLLWSPTAVPIVGVALR
jgi:hypothetical protein